MTEGKPADLVLYTADGGDELSRVVGAAQLVLHAGHSKRLYSHVAMLAYTPGYQWEAKFPFVGRFPIDITRPYEVWQVPGLTHGQRLDILHEAQRHNGDLYNLLGLFTDGRLSWRHAEVCSQLAGICYAKGGVDFSKEGMRILAPDMIPDYPGIRMIYRHIPPRETL